MKYNYWFKGFIFIALGCSISAYGSTVESSSSKSKKEPATQEVTKVFNVTVSTGQPQTSQASAKLSMSGDNSKVSVEKEGTITLLAGNSIQLLPGTKISSGGFLYATIDPGSKNNKHKKKETRIVTVEENKQIEEQAALTTAFNLFKPFPCHNRRDLQSGEPEQACFTSSTTKLSAVYPEQQRKVAVDCRNISEVSRIQILSRYNPNPVACSYRVAVMMVLRL